MIALRFIILVPILFLTIACSMTPRSVRLVQDCMRCGYDPEKDGGLQNTNSTTGETR